MGVTIAKRSYLVMDLVALVLGLDGGEPGQGCAAEMVPSQR